MQFNIYFEFSPFPKIEYGVDKLFVEKIVNAYLRGQPSIIIVGRSISISQSNLQIYSIPPELRGDSNYLRELFTKESQKHFRVRISEAVLGKYCRNVTGTFLLGRGWGDLKDDVYNVLIKSGQEKIVKPVVEKGELLVFINSWQNGLPKGFLGGKIFSFESLTSIAIYDIEIKHRKENDGETKKHVHEQLRIHFNNKWIIPALEEFGKDVTSTFKIGFLGTNSKALPQSSTVVAKETPKTIKEKIFISHSSKDAQIVKEFTDKILILCLGAESSKIFCTSIEGLGIKSGQDFRERIKKELLEAQIVIQIISKDYKASDVCLNEMGAAWVLAEKVIPLVVNIPYDVGFIHSTTHQLSLANRTDILQFIDDLSDRFPKKAKSAKIDRHLNDFLNAIK